jgi:hypothetical protein
LAHGHFLFPCNVQLYAGVFGSDHIPDSVGRLFGLLSRNATPFITVMLGVSSLSKVNLLFLGRRSLL